MLQLQKRLIPPKGSKKDVFSPTPWVDISPDDTIRFYSPPAEMGQGTLTTLALIFAEEFDADWEKVIIETSPTDDATFGNPIYWAHGIMLTVGSSTLPSYFMPMRKHGAQVRRIMIDSAADHWSVPASELSTKPSEVVHEKSGRSLSYGEIATFAKAPAKLPEIDEATLKDPKDFRLIGNVHVPRHDMVAKTFGTALFSIDVDLQDQGMLFARIIRAPVRHSRVVMYDDSKTSQLPGVQLVELPEGVGVVAADYETAWLGAEWLDVKWTDEQSSSFDSEKELEIQAQIAREISQEGFPLQNEGTINETIEGAHKVYELEVKTDFQYHAHLEPLNAVAWVTEGGAEIWAGSQAPTHLIRAVAKTLGIPESDVKLHRPYLGGGFGRRAAMDQDWVVDTVLLSKAVGKPVKMVYSREDDIKYGRFKPISAHYLRAAEDAGGNLIGFHHRVVTDEPLSVSDPWRYEKNGRFPITSHPALPSNYGFANLRTEVVKHKIPIRISPMRGVTATLNRFASETFIDEIAHARGEDPLDLRLGLLSDERAIAVLEKVTEISNWRSRADRSMGLSYLEVDELHAATVAEVAYPKNNGIIQVTKIWIAVDAGLVVHPYNATAQVEGAVLFALSNTLKERITITGGEIDQKTMEDYHILNMKETPELEIEFIASTHAPKGLGDLAGMGVAPAVANGFAALTGSRVHRFPLVPEVVLESLVVEV